MAVPKMSQLRIGLSVDIVLKSDQRSGRLTTGLISEILTRGDHPRGIKVRLNSGLVGRVQSLSIASKTLREPDNAVPPLAESSDANSRDYQEPQPTSARGVHKGLVKSYSTQSDYKPDQNPPESRSLADYIRLRSSRGPTPTSHTKAEATIQERMELEFPKLDSALIAAILADYTDLAETRGVLSTLS